MPDTAALGQTAACAGPLGWWRPDATAPRTGDAALVAAIQQAATPVCLVDVDGVVGVARGGTTWMGGARDDGGALPLLGFAPALRPEQLGDPAFRRAHGVRYAYVAGAMANGIASEALVTALGRAGGIGFFGAAGLELDRVEQAIDRIQADLGDGPYGFNLIHSPHDPALEAGVVELYLRRGVRRVSAAAYLGMTLPLVRYRVTGIHRDGTGRIVAPNVVFAKVSRVEVARKFFAPPPAEMLRALVADGAITDEQAELAAQIPVAGDLTAEADSGGHTDNRPALALLPTMLALRDEMQATHGYADRLRVGLAGGIATPASVAAAFAMGAAYVLTGTVNQACVESGTSERVRVMLAEASQADVTMAPAADMFEMGVQVQVLKRGTMFAMRARKLYELYRVHGSIEALPAAQRAVLERDFFRCTLEEAWQQTADFFTTRDPAQIARAQQDPRHKLALVFRKYLGQSSNWANGGDASRQVDYQVWCGPAIGAFNEWTAGTFLADPARRQAALVALNLLTGAAALTRAAWLRTQGAALPPAAETFAPREMAEIERLLAPDAV